ncbi:hypothetical protein [Streptomyces regalis]|uniref:Arsenate reductase n=1 Tax=Streptomyces regalis TaxID=68262 RepID=A0A101J6B6_9ACTN|nr:hypothetical protein [Streptomyces regalis]KUL21049.1 arsenate reductase [Streptomyces regalis]
MNEVAWVPQSCTLPTEERRLQLAQWDALFAERLIALAWPGPLRLCLHLADGSGVQDRVRELVRRESGCCSFFTFEVTPGRGRVQLDISVDAAHETVLEAIAARTGAAGESR